MTIPAALNLIVKVFPIPEEQSRAIAIFGGTGGIANSEFLSVQVQENILTCHVSDWHHHRCSLRAIPIMALGLLVRVYDWPSSRDCQPVANPA